MYQQCACILIYYVKCRLVPCVVVLSMHVKIIACMYNGLTSHFTHVLSAHNDLFAPVPADCGCDPAGTAGSSACDSSGQCNCKANVEGLQCTECREGSWNLTADNVQGCQGKVEC